MAIYKRDSKKNKMIKLKLVMEKLQRSLSLSKKSPSFDMGEIYEHGNDGGCRLGDSSYYVPKDVKEGHFAVVAMEEDGGVARRFVVPLKYLTQPLFLDLLERAAEVYGFDHRGALTIPCHPSEIERILAQ
ncbi:auxin-responsive protein SAUR50-like [Silene latifolia]|uniref:auxin-responsive protein SAUR50-like n=1 Tax=Silene latifolia TaxID=37657 RepID=UPI003D780F36